MPESTLFNELLKELEDFHKNLKKENVEKRRDPAATQRRLTRLSNYRIEFTSNKEKFLAEGHESEVLNRVKLICLEITQQLNLIEKLLKDRELEIKPKIVKVESKMPEENFDLKTAASLLPVMDGSEATTRSLIDGIELYEIMLNNNGKILLINYILKTRLSEHAKIRLNKTYPSIKELVDDIKKHFITRKSAAALAMQLYSTKQGGKSIDEFAKVVEELLVNLTISQANGDDNAQTILRAANEKTAISVFADGLSNNTLRTIVKARNCATLSDAISTAKELEPSGNQANQIFHMNRNQNFQQRPERGNFRGSFRGNQYSRQRNNYNQRGYNNQYNNSRNSNSNNNSNTRDSFNNNNSVNRNSTRNNGRNNNNNHRVFSNSNRGNDRNRGPHQNNSQRAYYTEVVEETVEVDRENRLENDQPGTFFRA